MESVVESVACQLLQFAIQVNQEVTASDEIDARKGRVLEQAVAGEKDKVPQFLPHPVMICFPGKKTPQTILADIGFDGRGIVALSRNGERPGIDVRAKN